MEVHNLEIGASDGERDSYNLLAYYVTGIMFHGLHILSYLILTPVPRVGGLLLHFMAKETDSEGREGKQVSLTEVESRA